MTALKALSIIKDNDFPMMVATYPPKPATMGGYTREELFEIAEKELKALEIIKSHAKENKHFKYLLYMAKYWEENKIEVTEELLYNYDFPYTKDEFDLLKEVLK